MIARAIAQHLLDRLHAVSDRSRFPVYVGLLSGAATVTSTVPVEWIVVTTTLLARHRWMAIAAWASLGGAISSLILYLAFHHFGWALLLRYYPDLASTQVWRDVTSWLSSYGSLALFGVMALPVPIPKLPALAFAGIYRLPVSEVLAAILAGKLVKYSAYAFATAMFPAHFRSLGRNDPVERKFH